MKISFLAHIITLLPLLSTAQEYRHIYKFSTSDESGWSTSCGSLENNEWHVSRNSCNLYSPEFTAGELNEYGMRTADIDLKLYTSGNLDEQDFAWVFYFIDDKPAGNKTIKGNIAGESVHFKDSLSVPARSKYRMRVAFVCDGSDEFWKLADGDLTISERAVEGEDFIEDKEATGKVFHVKERNLVKLYWNAESGRSGNYFQIERSKNGVDFEFAGFVKENQPTGEVTRYSFIDAGSFKPQTWYRVTQVDMGGNGVLYGKPISVKF